MIDHLSLKVRDFARSKDFFLAALAPLGYGLVRDYTPHAVGIGPEGRPVFWVVAAEQSAPTHVAFSARDRSMVGAFHTAALAAGGRDNGAPGLREHYHPHYFGAFVIDSEGNNIEAVCHRDPAEPARAAAPAAARKPARAKPAAAKSAKRPAKPAKKSAAKKRR
jgi:catechol 2,3-dioxygenase-like lactoylglutathione lyase family enzyme